MLNMGSLDLHSFPDLSSPFFVSALHSSERSLGLRVQNEPDHGERYVPFVPVGE